MPLGPIRGEIACQFPVFCRDVCKNLFAAILSPIIPLVLVAPITCVRASAAGALDSIDEYTVMPEAELALTGSMKSSSPAKTVNVADRANRTA